MEWTFHAIGQIHTPCKEKFGLPRQSGLVPELTGEIEIFAPFDRDETFLELNGFSHIWVISVFHLAVRDQWQPMVRPPRLGGNRKTGVFASRAPYRPNPIGLSVFRLVEIVRRDNKLVVCIEGNDLVEGTPVLDIKPYLPYADSVPQARGGYADEISRNILPVIFSDDAKRACARLESGKHVGLKALIIALLEQDPRPAYKHGHQTEFGMQLYDLNIRFSIEQGMIEVIGIDEQDRTELIPD